MPLKIRWLDKIVGRKEDDDDLITPIDPVGLPGGPRLHIEEVVDGDIVKAKLAGNLTENTGQAFKEWFEQREKRDYQFDIDFSELEVMTSAGIRVLVELYDWAKTLVVRNPRPHVARSIQITGNAEFFGLTISRGDR